MTVLRKVLKTSAEILTIRDIDTLTQWRDTLAKERACRMNIFESLLSDDEKLTTEVGDEKQQLELLTLMKHDFEIYGAVLTEIETDVIVELYTRVVRRSGLVVGTIPSWFATTTSMWPGAAKTSMDGENEERFLRQVAIWSELRHPHVRKLYGACHVGEPFIIHEPSSLISAEELSWNDLLGLALGLECVHRRGFLLEQVSGNTIVQLSSERKLVLTGMELVRRDGMSKLSTASNVMALGIALLDLLICTRGGGGQENAMSKQLPDRQPAHINDREWQLLCWMCCTVPAERPSMSNVIRISRYKELANEQTSFQPW